jgi:hypothetical protein
LVIRQAPPIDDDFSLPSMARARDTSGGGTRGFISAGLLSW